MNIIRLNLRNYRSFPELEVHFQPVGVNVLVGVNGSGKSTVLDAIGSMMQHMVARLKTESGRGAPIAEADIMVGASEAGIGICFEENGNTYSFEVAGARLGFSRGGACPAALQTSPSGLPPTEMLARKANRSSTLFWRTTE